MSGADVEQAVAAVLAEHADWYVARSNGAIRCAGSADCEWTASHDIADSAKVQHRSHVAAEIAAALAPLLAAERARALDEAAEAWDLSGPSHGWTRHWLRERADREREATT